MLFSYNAAHREISLPFDLPYESHTTSCICTELYHRVKISPAAFFHMDGIHRRWGGINKTSLKCQVI